MPVMKLLDNQIVSAVLAHGRRSAGVEAVEGVYAEIDEFLAGRSPTCRACGTCCRFGEYGHLLFVTSIELVYVVAGLLGAGRVSEAVADRLQGLRRQELDGGACPFQDGGRCTIRPIRPSGCRLFYCDWRKDEEFGRMYERVHGRLARASETITPPYVYVEWAAAARAMLSVL